MLQELNQASLEVGLSMNFKKTKIMRNKHAEDTNRKITIYSNEIEEVDHYIYLGQRISMETASEEQEIKRRITLGWQAFGRASAIFKNKEIPTCLKRQVYNQCMLLLLSTPLHQRAASRVQHPNHVAASSLSPPGGKEWLHFVGIRPEVQARKGGW